MAKKLSGTTRIVNVSSGLGAIEVILSDVDGLTEEKVDEVVSWFLQDAKEDGLESKGWFTHSAYVVSKASPNACKRFLAKKFPKFGVNSVSPSFCKTYMSFNNGHFMVEGVKGPVKLALMVGVSRNLTSVNLGSMLILDSQLDRDKFPKIFIFIQTEILPYSRTLVPYLLISDSGISADNLGLSKITSASRPGHVVPQMILRHHLGHVLSFTKYAPTTAP
ncbi:hypothetical protein ACSBR2_007617 [Camellia fascicularis]